MGTSHLQNTKRDNKAKKKQKNKIKRNPTPSE